MKPPAKLIKVDTLTKSDESRTQVFSLKVQIALKMYKHTFYSIIPNWFGDLEVISQRECRFRKPQRNFKCILIQIVILIFSLIFMPAFAYLLIKHELIGNSVYKLGLIAKMILSGSLLTGVWVAAVSHCFIAASETDILNQLINNEMNLELDFGGESIDVGGTILLLFMIACNLSAIPVCVIVTFFDLNPLTLVFNEILLPHAYYHDRGTVLLSSLVAFILILFIVCGMIVKALQICLILSVLISAVSEKIPIALVFVSIEMLVIGLAAAIFLLSIASHARVQSQVLIKANLKKFRTCRKGSAKYRLGQEVLYSWKFHDWGSSQNNKVMSKFRKSCKPIVVNYGNTYVIRSALESSPHHDRIGLARKILSLHSNTCSVVLTSIRSPSKTIEWNEFFNPIEKDNKIEETVFLFGLHEVQNLSGKAEFPKHTSFCKVIITAVNGLESKFSGPSFSQLFQNVLTPLHSPFTKRNEDYYILLANSENSMKSIFTSGIGREIKFKIVILPTSAIYSHCIFCYHKNIMEVNFLDTEIPPLRNIFPDYTKDFQGYPLRVTAPTQFPSVSEMSMENGFWKHKRGLNVHIFQYMQLKLNFTYVLHPCSGNGNTGTKLLNGTWIGCVGDVLSRTKDLAITIAPSLPRVSVVEFTPPILHIYLTYVTHKPRVVSSWKTIFYAFDAIGWILLVVSILILGIEILGIEQLLLRKQDVKILALESNILYIYGYLLGQSIYIETRAKASELLLWIWLCCGFIIGACYCCSLQSLIISPRLTPVPETLEDLAILDYSWGSSEEFLKRSVGGNILRQSGIPIVKNIYGEFQTDENQLHCLRRAVAEDYACFAFDISTKFYIAQYFMDNAENHPFQFAKANVFSTATTFITRKREIFMLHFNNFIARAFCMGLTEQIWKSDSRQVRLQKRRKENADHSTVKRNSSLNLHGPLPFTLDNVKASFFILLCGKFIAFLCFVKEFIVARFCTKRRAT
ncbi:unnamed protein product [Orchesella dallaii]|uniref:Uncharacterized protein n=1 Tax=Orchesella dallaii TaxID=48710 RepID=A0ABP1R6A1_9HEXA